MTTDEKLEQATQYEAVLRFCIEVKESLIACDAPHRAAIFAVLDKTANEMYGEPYESERFVDELKELIENINP